MSITTYSELDTAIDNWAHRSDLSDRIAEFIVLTEERMWYGDEDPQFGNEPLRVREMETTSSLTIDSSGNASIPTGFLQGIRLYVTSGGVDTDLRYYPRTDFHSRANTQDAGVPDGYTIEGENFVFGSRQTGTPKLLYYQKLTALDSATGTSSNSILTTRPSVYLSGALLELNLFIKNWDEATIWARKFRNAIGGWNAASRRDRRVGPLISSPVAVA